MQIDLLLFAHAYVLCAYISQLFLNEIIDYLLNKL